jgi:apolipoprotein N-acyltransferase
MIDRRNLISQILLPILSAGLFILAFPKFNISILAWAALIPLLFTIHRTKKSSEAFISGMFFGFLSYAGILYWIVPTCLAAEQHILLALLGLSALSAYLSIYTGLFTYFYHKLLGNIKQKFLIPFFTASVWITLEFVKANLLTGFPWCLLGYSQWNIPFLIQISEYTGVYGVSFFIVFFNSLFAGEIKHIIANKKVSLQLAVASSITLLLFLGSNLILYSRNPKSEPEYKVSILQGNIDQYKKWDKAYEKEVITAYSELAEKAAETDPIIIIWPETAVPGWIPNDTNFLSWIQNTSIKTGTYNLIGAATYAKDMAFNAAFMLSEKGEIRGQYRKTHLVPFGETVPFQKMLGKWIPILNDLGNFYPAEEGPVLLNSPIGNLGVNICFEAIFPRIVREIARKGGVISVNLTNDAWFLKTAAPEQHFITNIFRAVETRNYVIRAANTGISGIINPDGSIQVRSELFERKVIEGKVSPLKRKTFYIKYGNVFLCICALFLFSKLFIFFWHSVE